MELHYCQQQRYNEQCHKSDSRSISNYSKDATVVISTHLIEDIEPVLDEAVFLKDGKIFAHRAVDDIRETEGKSVDAYFREVFKC